MVRKPGEKRQTETHTHTHEEALASHEQSEDARQQQAQRAMAVVEELRGKLRTGGRKFTHDEMNER